jgi:UDP-glucose 4-epimerase
LRLTNTYGPRLDLRSDTKGFVGIFLRRALQGEHIDLFGTGEQKRDFNYVDDVVDALLRAGQTPEIYGQALNLGHPRPYSLNELVDILAGLADFTHAKKAWPADREKIDVGDYYGDYSRFKEATGWEPEVDLAEGLKKTVEFFRQHASHYL